LIAVAAGAGAALGFAPWNLWPLTLIGIATLLALIDAAATARRAALLGWLFGTGHFTLGLGWIATAFTFQAKMPAALGWVTVVLLAMFLALYPALAAGLTRRFTRRPLPQVLVFAALWMLTEWLRGWVLSGFAWNPLGAAWLEAPGVAQLASLVGAVGLSGLLVLAAGGLWLLALGPRFPGAVLAALTLIATVGGASLERSYRTPDFPLVYLVQPNIGQDVKYVPGAQDRHFQTYLDLTADALAAATRPRDAGIPAAPALPTAKDFVAVEKPVDPILTAPAAPAAPAASAQTNAGITDELAPKRPGAIILWSESALPYAVEEEPGVRARLASVIGPDDLLLFGGVAVMRDAAGEVTALTNSLFVLDSKGTILGRYDKAHLVPLGEYVPARALMTALGVARLAPGDIDFYAGPGPRTLDLPGFSPVGVQICYEIIFPGRVIDAANRPAWIANISNDAWFGPSGPPQHLAQARLRAIEEGLPIARVTPTGISAMIDAHGRLTASIDAGVQGVESAPLPAALPPTLFARHGHLAPALFGLLLLLAGLALDTGGARRPQLGRQII
jgi:apolipoprotein N-acyltransferase